MSQQYIEKVMSGLPLQQWLRKRVAIVTLHVHCLQLPLITSLLHNYIRSGIRKKSFLRLTKHFTGKSYGGVEVQPHGFLWSALEGNQWSASRPYHFSPRYTQDRKILRLQGQSERLEIKISV